MAKGKGGRGRRGNGKMGERRNFSFMFSLRVFFHNNTFHVFEKKTDVMIAEGRKIGNIILKPQPVASVIFTAPTTPTRTSLTVIYMFILVGESSLPVALVIHIF